MFKVPHWRLISFNNKENSCSTDVYMIIILIVVIRHKCFMSYVSTKHASVSCTGPNYGKH